MASKKPRLATPQCSDTQLDTEFDIASSRLSSAGTNHSASIAELSQRPAWACPAGRLRLLARLQAHQSSLAQQTQEYSSGAEGGISNPSQNGHIADAVQESIPSLHAASRTQNGSITGPRYSTDQAPSAVNVGQLDGLKGDSSLPESSDLRYPASVARTDGLLQEFESLHARILHHYLESDPLK